MPDTLQSWASARGYRVAWGPASIIEEVKADITSLADSGALDATFFHSELGDEVIPQEHHPDQSVVMIAIPRPAHRVSFNLAEVGGGMLEAVLPPTYVHYRSLFEEVRQDLVLNGLPGSRVEHLHGPHKGVAARVGLVKYGRNNITYAPGIGSYLQLCGYVTDAPLPPAQAVLGPELLPECEDCRRCLKVCPTQAIGADRMLLRAQHCLTLAGENPGPWPDRIPGRAHHCLVGCLLCQRICPVNPPLRVEDTGLSFSAQETKALLETPEELPRNITSAIRKKLAWLGPVYLEGVLGRNLAALMRDITPHSSSSGPPARTGSFPA